MVERAVDSVKVAKVARVNETRGSRTRRGGITFRSFPTETLEMIADAVPGGAADKFLYGKREGTRVGRVGAHVSGPDDGDLLG